MTRDTILNNVIINDIAPKTASAEASHLLGTRVCFAVITGPPWAPHRLAYPSSTSTGPLLSTGTLSLGGVHGSPSPSMVTVYRLPIDPFPLPDSAYDQWPDFSGADTRLPALERCARSIASLLSSSDFSARNFDHSDEVLQPVPKLPTFRRTRQGWRQSSWNYLQRKFSSNDANATQTGESRENLLSTTAARESRVDISTARKMACGRRLSKRSRVSSELRFKSCLGAPDDWKWVGTEDWTDQGHIVQTNDQQVWIWSRQGANGTMKVGERQTSTYCIDKDHHDIPGFAFQKRFRFMALWDLSTKASQCGDENGSLILFCIFSKRVVCTALFTFQDSCIAIGFGFGIVLHLTVFSMYKKFEIPKSEALGMNTMYQKGSWAMEFMKIFRAQKKGDGPTQGLRSMDESI